MRKGHILAAALALLLLLPVGCGRASTAAATEIAAAEPADSEPAASTAANTADFTETTEPEAAAASGEAADYADTLFDTSYVHTIDILVPDGDWTAFIRTCTSKEYMACDMVIDGETVTDAAIRGKGNSSMQRSQSSGKYSFKVEFDHYADGASYHGLDKLSLNNLVVDDSCMRDYVVYRMMDEFGVPAPLCSYVFITVNGEDWGFYLAVEGVEDAFLERNYGAEHGNLYKPDNLNNGGAGGGGGMGSQNDVKLLYIDDDPASYPNIFDSAKTDISRRDRYVLIESLRKLNALEDVESVVDTEAMLRYLVAHTFVSNGDSYTGSSVHNYYLYEKDGVLSMIPWDYNEAFGDFGSGSVASAVNDPIDSPVTSGTLEDRPMVAWVFSSDEYVARYHALYADFLTRLWDSGYLADLIGTTRALIAPYIERDPISYVTVDEFEAGVTQLLTFFELRAESVRGQLNGTIPSTAEGQAADSSALVDASALGSTGGFGGFGGGNFGGMPSREASREASGEASR